MNILDLLPRPFWEGEDEGAGGSAGESPAAEDENPPAAEGEEPAGSLLGGKTEEEPQAAEPPLEELPIPEGLEIPDERQSEILELVNGAETKADLVKGLMDVYAAEMKSAAEQADAAWLETQKEWQAAVRAAPEFQGEKLTEALAQAKGVLKDYGSPELLDLMDITGAGNNVEMLRFLTKVAEVLPREAEPVAGQPTTGEKSLAERLFPSS